LALKTPQKTCLIADGQVSLGSTIVKSNAVKVRSLLQDQVHVGFAGSVADAFFLLNNLEGFLERYPSNPMKACIEFAQQWRTGKQTR
jgi:ATP-dependent HslUV protease, peptidase subunit HslV